MRNTLIAIGVIGALIFFSGGFKADPGQKGFNHPGKTTAPEYNCLEHAKDGICEVPMKDRVVLYCVKPPFKRIVHSREDCV